MDRRFRVLPIRRRISLGWGFVLTHPSFQDIESLLEGPLILQESNQKNASHASKEDLAARPYHHPYEGANDKQNDLHTPYPALSSEC